MKYIGDAKECIPQGTALQRPLARGMQELAGPKAVPLHPHRTSPNSQQEWLQNLWGQKRLLNDFYFIFKRNWKCVVGTMIPFSEGVKQHESHASGTKAITMCVPTWLTSKISILLRKEGRLPLCFPIYWLPAAHKTMPRAPYSGVSEPPHRAPAYFYKFISQYCTSWTHNPGVLGWSDAWASELTHQISVPHSVLPKWCDFGQDVQPSWLRFHILKIIVFGTN